MAIKIMVDPGHMQGWNTTSCGYSEGTRMWDLSRILIPILESYGFIVGCTKKSINDYPKNSYGDDDITTRGRMAAGYDLMISLHTNACGADYVQRPVVIYPISGKYKDLADNIAYQLHVLYGNTDKPSYQTFYKYNSSGNADYYGVIRGAAQKGVPCLIIEHTFHTSSVMAKWMLSDDNLKKMAQTVASTIAKYFGYTQTSTPSNPSTSTATTSSLQVGDTMHLMNGATYISGTAIPSWVIASELFVREIRSNGDIVFSTQRTGAVTGVVSAKYVVEANSNSTPYLVKVTTAVLNVRKGPSTSYSIATQVKNGEVYTIVEEKDGWGRLKSGAGWICLDYTKKI